MNLNKYYYDRKRAALKKRLLFFIYSFFGLALLAWVFFWLPYFRISKIQIKDPYYTSGEDKEVKIALAPFMGSKNNMFLPKNNFFIFSSSEAENLLRQNNFGVAEVNKHFPNKLEVIFPKNEPKFIFCLSEDCYYVGAEGSITQKAPQISENILPLLVLDKLPAGAAIGDQLMAKPVAQFLSSFTGGLKNIDLAAKRAEVGEGEIKIFTKEGWIILLSSETLNEKIFENLKLILDEKVKQYRPSLEYVDLRFPDKAFYKLKPVNHVD